jgi:hypothetical protein
MQLCFSRIHETLGDNIPIHALRELLGETRVPDPVEFAGTDFSNADAGCFVKS